MFTNYIQKAEASKKSEGCVGLFSKGVLVLLCAIFVGKCFSSLPGSRRYNNLPPPINFNAAMPRFTPVMPELKPQPLVFHIPPSMLEVGMILKTVVAVDTSAKNEYDAKHITGALSIPAGKIAAHAKRLPKSKQIVFYGSDMDAAMRAALELQALGFDNVALLEGGLQAWEDAKLPVTRPKAANRSRDRLVVKGALDPQ